MSHALTPADLRDDQIRIADWHIASKLPYVGLGLGVVALGAAYALSSADMTRYYFSYLAAFLFGLTIALGCLFFVLVQYATRAGWSVVVRRIAESFMFALPVFAVLFLPVFLGRHELYHWTHTDVVEADAMLKQKAPYLNEGSWTVRAIVYFVIWAGVAHLFARKSRAQDQEGGTAITAFLQKMSYPSIMLFALSITFAAIDWNKSLDPHWFSTMWGVYQFAGAYMSAIATITLVTLFFLGTGLLRGVVTEDHRHDLGKLLFAFTVFWTYIAFGQYFLIWYGNMPEETMWYAHRMGNSWEGVGIGLMIGHFALPFFFLMSRHVKRSMGGLAVGALWMLFMHYVDIYYQVLPTHDHHGVHPSIVDVLNVVGIGGVLFGCAFWAMKGAALVPPKDPRLGESLAFQNL